MDKPLVSIVFSAYKNERYIYILKALDTISRQTYKNFEVIIVVDGNSHLYSVISKLEDRNDIKLRILNNEKRGGPSVARNMGIEKAKGDIIAIIDDDVFISSNWLEHIVKNFEKRNIMMVGGKILPVYEDSSALPEEVLWLVGCTYKGHPDKRQYVRNVISANMAFRKRLFDIVTFEKLPVDKYWRMSDTLIGIRLNEINPESVMYDPNLVVYHNVPKERTEFKYIVNRSYTEGYLKSIIGKVVKTKNVYNYESNYLTTILSSILKYIITFRIRFALINSVVLVSVLIGFLVGSSRSLAGYGPSRTG